MIRAPAYCAIDRTNKLLCAKLKPAHKCTGTDFLNQWIALIPYKINMMLTDNGMPFTNPTHAKYASKHPFDRIGLENNIAHRLTSPLTLGPTSNVEGIHKTIKEATVKKYPYRTPTQLNELLHLFFRL